MKPHIYKKNETTTLARFKEVFIELVNATWKIEYEGETYTVNIAEKGWKPGFNNHRTSLGLCVYGEKVVYVSKYFLKQNLDNAHEAEDTVRHEIAHAIDQILFGYSDGHGKRWKAIAKQVGATPKATCENAQRDERAKYTLVCPSGHSKKAYRRPVAGAVCSQCCKVTGYNPKFKLIVVEHY